MKAVLPVLFRCKKVCKFDEPFKVDPEYGGPEYETLAAFGSDCGINDLKSIVRRTNVAMPIRWTRFLAAQPLLCMECFEKGYLTLKDTGGWN